MNIKGAQLLLVLSIALMGCSESPDEELIFEGQHINYYSSAGTTQVCEGSFYVQDVFVASVANYFGVELPEPVNFIFTQKKPCSSSCVFDGEVFSDQQVHFHELVHAVLLNGGVE
ncbi:MAG: hypothetical protein ACPG4T_16210, partial [Nannocystaceae bacterium]